MNFQNWKVNTVEHYNSAHNWIKRTCGKAICCVKNKEHKANVYEWANISGQYKKDVRDWIQLCPSCHRKFDYKEEYREMIKERNKGNKYHSKKIKQFTIGNVFVREWSSTVEVEKTLGILRSSISNVLAGRSQTAGKWRWAR